MRYRYHIEYGGRHKVADTAGQAAAILRVLDGETFRYLFEQDLAGYLRGNVYMLRKWDHVLNGHIWREEVPFVLCANCKRHIYRDSIRYVVKGVEGRFCSASCAAYYLLDVRSVEGKDDSHTDE